MKIVALGGGPAGLYFAISMKLRNPDHEVTVIERNRPDDTFGWGVVLSDDALENQKDNDPKSAEEIRSNFAYWDDIAVHYRGKCIVSGGHGFCGIGRKKLLLILQARAREVGPPRAVGDYLAGMTDRFCDETHRRICSKRSE